LGGGVAEEAFHGVCERVGIFRGHQDAAEIGAYDFGDAAHVRGDHGDGCGHGLHGGVAEAFLAGGHDQEVDGAHEQGNVVEESKEEDLLLQGRGLPLQVFAFGTFAGQDERPVGVPGGKAGEGVDEYVDALFAAKAGGGANENAGFGKAEALASLDRSNAARFGEAGKIDAVVDDAHAVFGNGPSAHEERRHGLGDGDGPGREVSQQKVGDPLVRPEGQDGVFVDDGGNPGAPRRQARVVGSGVAVGVDGVGMGFPDGADHGVGVEGRPGGAGGFDDRDAGLAQQGCARIVAAQIAEGQPTPARSKVRMAVAQVEGDATGREPVEAKLVGGDEYVHAGNILGKVMVAWQWKRLRGRDRPGGQSGTACRTSSCRHGGR
jgi:hypothetical protein